ncbi:ER membrane complex subunit 6 [Ancistrocladus abbreviatus]
MAAMALKVASYKVALQFSQLCMFSSIIGGVVAGILGFRGFTGFVLHFLVMAICSVGLIAKAKFSVHSYFDCWNRVITDGFLSGLVVHSVLLCSVVLSF